MATVLVRKGRKINKGTQPQHLLRLHRTNLPAENFRVLEGRTWPIQDSDQLVEASPLYLLSGREGLALFSHCSEYCWYLHWHGESNTLLFTGNAALGTAFEWRENVSSHCNKPWAATTILSCQKRWQQVVRCSWEPVSQETALLPCFLVKKHVGKNLGMLYKFSQLTSPEVSSTKEIWVGVSTSSATCSKTNNYIRWLTEHLGSCLGLRIHYTDIFSMYCG